MVDTGIFCTTQDVKDKTGSGASATSNAEAYINHYVSEAESFINAWCNYNYSDAYAALNADKKGLLREAASNYAAMYVINYDMSGYTSNQEAVTMINYLWARAVECMNLLKSPNVNTFVQAA